MRNIAFLLSLVLIFVIPWENMVGFESLGTLSRTIGLLVAGFWVVAVVATGRFRKVHPFHVVFYLFILWNVASFFWSMDADATLDRIITYLQLFVLTLIIWDMYTSPAALRLGLQVYVLGAFAPIAATLQNYLSGTESLYLRYAATGFGTDDLGLTLALGIPIAWFLFSVPRKTKRDYLLMPVNFSFIPLALLGIFLTAARTSLIAAVLACLFGLATLVRQGALTRAIVIVVLLVSLFATGSFVPQSSIDRLSTTGASVEEGDLNGRVAIWQEGLDVWSNQPVLGIGAGAFRSAIGANGVPKVAHNVFVSILVELGIIGVLIFVAMLAIVAREAIRLPKWDAAFWLTVLLVWAIGASSLTWEIRKPTWLLLTLLVAASNFLARRGESAVLSERRVPRGEAVVEVPASAG